MQYILMNSDIFSNDTLLQLRSTFTYAFQTSLLSGVSNVASFRFFNSASNPIFPTSTLSSISRLNSTLLNTLTASNFTFNPSAAGNTARQQADVSAYTAKVKIVTDSLEFLFGNSNTSSIYQFNTMQLAVYTNANFLYSSIQAMNVREFLSQLIKEYRQFKYCFTRSNTSCN